MPLEKELLVASVFPVCFQWSSNDLPVVFQCVPIMQINTGSPLGHHWVLASASVVPVAFQCTCGSSGLPVCSNYANEHWIATGLPLGASISQAGSSDIPVYLWLQWSSSVVYPVVSQCTDRIWFGGHKVRSLPSMQATMCTTDMVRVVWVKRISFDLQPQIHKTIMVLISKACTEWCWSTHMCWEPNWYPL